MPQFAIASPRGRILPLALAILLAGLAAPASVALAQDADPAPLPPPAEAGAADRDASSGRKLTKAERKALKRQRKEDERRRKERKRMEALDAKTALEWYREALDRYERGKYLAAREILLPLEDSIRAADIQEQVKLLIADTYFYQGGSLNLAEALARYRSFLTFYPTSDKAEYAQFQVASSYFRQLGPADRDQSFTDSAIAEYERFLQGWPDSQWADEARRNALEARALRARAEFEVAEFYWDWENWDAAAARLAAVLANHPALPERERALYMAAQAHYLTGDVDSGHAYAARLAEDYPESSWVRKLDPDAAASKGAARANRRETKIERDAERTKRRQLARDRKRTRQIRKDSGLPAIVPGDREVVGAVEGGAAEGGGADGVGPAAEIDADAGSPRREAREEQRSERERRRMERAEAEEQAEAKRREEREAKREEKRRAEEEKRRRKQERKDGGDDDDPPAEDEA